MASDADILSLLREVEQLPTPSNPRLLEAQIALLWAIRTHGFDAAAIIFHKLEGLKAAIRETPRIDTDNTVEKVFHAVAKGLCSMMALRDKPANPNLRKAAVDALTERDFHQLVRCTDWLGDVLYELRTVLIHTINADRKSVKSALVDLAEAIEAATKKKSEAERRGLRTEKFEKIGLPFACLFWTAMDAVVHKRTISSSTGSCGCCSNQLQVQGGGEGSHQGETAAEPVVPSSRQSEAVNVVSEEDIDIVDYDSDEDAEMLRILRENNAHKASSSSSQPQEHAEISSAASTSAPRSDDAIEQQPLMERPSTAGDEVDSMASGVGSLNFVMGTPVSFSDAPSSTPSIFGIASSSTVIDGASTASPALSTSITNTPKPEEGKAKKAKKTPSSAPNAPREEKGTEKRSRTAKSIAASSIRTCTAEARNRSNSPAAFCDYCEYAATEQGLKIHLAKYHKEAWALKKEEARRSLPPSICNQCGKSFANRYVLRKHLEVKHAVTMDQQPSSSSAALSRSSDGDLEIVASGSGGEEPPAGEDWICCPHDNCHSSLATQPTLLQHMIEVHPTTSIDHLVLASSSIALVKGEVRTEKSIAFSCSPEAAVPGKVSQRVDEYKESTSGTQAITATSGGGLEFGASRLLQGFAQRTAELNEHSLALSQPPAAAIADKAQLAKQHPRKRMSAAFSQKYSQSQQQLQHAHMRMVPSEDAPSTSRNYMQTNHSVESKQQQSRPPQSLAATTRIVTDAGEVAALYQKFLLEHAVQQQQPQVSQQPFDDEAPSTCLNNRQQHSVSVRQGGGSRFMANAPSSVSSNTQAIFFSDRGPSAMGPPMQQQPIMKGHHVSATHAATPVGIVNGVDTRCDPALLTALTNVLTAAIATSSTASALNMINQALSTPVEVVTPHALEVVDSADRDHNEVNKKDETPADAVVQDALERALPASPDGDDASFDVLQEAPAPTAPPHEDNSAGEEAPANEVAAVAPHDAPADLEDAPDDPLQGAPAEQANDDAAAPGDAQAVREVRVAAHGVIVDIRIPSTYGREKAEAIRRALEAVTQEILAEGSGVVPTSRVAIVQTAATTTPGSSHDLPESSRHVIAHADAPAPPKDAPVPSHDASTPTAAVPPPVAEVAKVVVIKEEEPEVHTCNRCGANFTFTLEQHVCRRQRIDADHDGYMGDLFDDNDVNGDDEQERMMRRSSSEETEEGADEDAEQQDALSGASNNDSPGSSSHDRPEPSIHLTAPAYTPAPPKGPSAPPSDAHVRTAAARRLGVEDKEVLDNVFMCAGCGEDFASERLLEEHKSLIHIGEPDDNDETEELLSVDGAVVGTPTASTPRKRGRPRKNDVNRGGDEVVRKKERLDAVQNEMPVKEIPGPPTARRYTFQKEKEKKPSTSKGLLTPTKKSPQGPARISIAERSKLRSRPNNDAAGSSGVTPAKKLKKEDSKCNKAESKLDAEKERKFIERTRKKRLEEYTDKDSDVFDIYKQMRRNIDILISDFAHSQGMSLEELTTRYDELWTALPRFKPKLCKKTRSLCEAMMHNGDDDEINLLYLVAYLNGNDEEKKMGRIESLYRTMNADTPKKAIKQLWKEDEDHPLIFRLENDNTNLYLSIDKRAVPVQGIRKGVLAVVAATFLFNATFGARVDDIASFFYVHSGLELDDLTKEVKAARKIVE